MRSVEKRAEQLGVKHLSEVRSRRWPGPAPGHRLERSVAGPGRRPLAGSWVDALVIKVRANGRTVNVRTLVAVGVNSDGSREVLGLDMSRDEVDAGRLAVVVVGC